MRWGLLGLALVAGCTKAPAPTPPVDAGRVALGPPVAEVLALVGARLALQQTNTCTWTETTTVTQLAEDGSAKARETLVFSVAPKAGHPHRTRVEVRKELGDLPARMRPPSDDEMSPEERERRGRTRPAFHPGEQALYEFNLRKVEAGLATVTFMPKEATLERGLGTGVIDLDGGRLVSIESRPSKPLPLLREFSMAMQYGPGPCGDQPVSARFQAEGGFLGMEMKVEARSAMTGYALVDGGSP